MLGNWEVQENNFAKWWVVTRSNKLPYKSLSHPSHKNWWPKNLHLLRSLTTSRLNGKYLLSEMWHRQLEKGVGNYKGLPTSSENFVNLVHIKRVVTSSADWRPNSSGRIRTSVATPNRRVNMMVGLMPNSDEHILWKVVASLTLMSPDGCRPDTTTDLARRSRVRWSTYMHTAWATTSRKLDGYLVIWVLPAAAILA